MKNTLTLFTALLLAPLTALSQPATTPGRGAETVSIYPSLLEALHSPILFKGDERIGYRDPLLLWHDSTFHLFFTVGERERNTVYLYLAKSTSRDLHTWTPTQKLSVRDLSLNFVSPGSVVRFGGEWILCASTYPQPKGETFGNGPARL